PTLQTSLGLFGYFTHHVLGSAWRHSIPACSPYTYMDRLFSSPTEIWLAQRIPFAPPSNITNTLPSSSGFLPGTNVVRSAHIASILPPVMYSARFSACVPMSPIQPLAPALVGSVRQSACLFSCDASTRVESLPWGYAATTLRILPK